MAVDGWMRREPAPRYYTPDQLGGLCTVCGEPLPAALVGITEHPTCDGDFQPLMAAYARAERRRRAEARAAGRAATEPLAAAGQTTDASHHPNPNRKARP